MTDSSPKRGRTHDAERTREAILDAAEKVFAEHGFDGARIDAIAAEASYNKSLIFQYFGDKLGLYAAVIRQVQEQTSGLQEHVLEELMMDVTFSNVDKLKTLFKTYLTGYFDYLVEHPRLMKIFIWEMAEGWQTYAKILSPSDFEEMQQFKIILKKIQAAGVLRSDFEPGAQLFLAQFLYPCFLALLPFHQILLPDEDSSSPAALMRARDYIIDFVIHGLFADST